MSARRVLIRNARWVRRDAPPGEVGWALLEDEVIAAMGDGEPGADMPRDEDLDACGLWALPGWIDLQINDIDWLSRGQRKPTEHAQRIREVLRYQAERGVTGCVLATLAAPLDEIESYLSGMKSVLDSHESLDDVLLGGLVEGTFMNPAFHGAHNPRWVLAPDRAVLDRLLDTGAVRLINIAPETGPDAVDLIRHATDRGAIVGCGHAKPHAERVREAVEAGLRYVIHLGNGPTGSHWKRFNDGGLLEEALRNDELVATIIVDGWHVHPQLVRDWIARKEIERCVGVSDAGFAMGAPEGGFEVFGIRGELAPDGGYLRVVPEDSPESGRSLTSDVSALFGSAIGMREVFENLVRLFSADMEGVYYRRHAGMSMEESIDAASRLCSRNPARLLGEDDRGELRIGSRADVVLLDVSGGSGAQSVTVQRCLVAGR